MATPACTLTEEQIRTLYKAVSGKIIADKNNGVKHDIEDYMKKLYEMLRTAPGGSDATAMDYIQHIPRMLLAAKGTMSEDLSDYLSDSGVDLNRMDKLRVQFKNIENVKSFLNTNINNPIIETAKEVIAEALPTDVIDGTQYTEIEDKDRQQKEKANTNKPFDALPDTALAQVNQEAQDYDGIEAKQNIPDPDPKIKTYFNLVRLINKFINKTGQTNANSLGIYLRAVRENAIPVEDLYVRHQRYLSTNDSNKTAEDKQRERETGDGMLLVYTDKEGNFLHFDKDGNITTKEAGGTIAYSAVRRVYKNSNGTRSVAKVQSVDDLVKKPGAPTREELQEGRNAEMDLLEKLREHVKNNPDDKIIFSVTAGKNGYVREDFSVRNKISDVELENGFSPFYSPKTSGLLQEGGVYFMVPGYEMPVLIKRPKFSEVPSFSEAIASVLFSGMNAEDKMNLLKQFVNIKKTEVYEKDGKVYVKFENSDDVIDTSDKTNRDLFIQNINKETVNINKNLLGKSFDMPSMNADGSPKIDSKLYNNFLSDNFYTNLQKNAEGKIVNLNAYNVLQVTPEATNKLFPAPVQAAPVSTDAKADIERRKNQKLQELYNSEIEKEDRDALNKIYNTGKIGDTISVGVYTFTKTGEDEWTSSDDAGSFSYSTEKMGNIYFDIEKGKSKEATALAFLAAKLNTNNVEIPQKEIENLPLIKQILNIEKEAKAELAALEEKPTETKVDVEAEKKKLEAERDRRIEEEAPIQTMDYPLGFMSDGKTISLEKISELLKEDKQNKLKALERIALILAEVGVQPLYIAKQNPEVIKKILSFYPNYYGALRDWEGKDIDALSNKNALRITNFFNGFQFKDIPLAWGVRFSNEKSEYTSKQIKESSAVQEKLGPSDRWSTEPNMGYVAALRWAEMKLAGQTTRSLGEFLLDTQKEIRDEYQAKIAALEGGINVNIEQTTPSDNPIDVLKEKLKNSGRLKKASSLSSEATDEQIVAAEQWYKSSPLAQHVPFQVLMNIVNSDAVADFTLAGITLYQGSNFTDLYHEGWHVFSQMFLTKEQKQKLYGEARKLKGTFKTVDGNTVKFSSAKDIELEEFMGEDYRKYILSGQKTIIDGRPARNSIFKKIFNFLKELFKGQSYNSIVADMRAVGTIKNLYDKLYIGDINEYRPSLNNVQFTLLNKGIQVLDAKENQNEGLTYQDSMTIVQTIDSELAATITELGGSLGSMFTDPTLMESVYSIVRDRISELGKKLDPTSNGARIINFTLQNWGSFNDVASGKQTTGVLAFHKLRSDYLTFDEKYAEMTPDEKVIAQDAKEVSETDENKLGKSDAQLAEEFGSRVGENKGNENSVFTNASNETVWLIKSLPAVDKNGKPELNSLGSAKLVDFNRTWGIVINAVAGSINKTDMYDRLNAASKIHPELTALVERLQKPMDKTNVATDAAFIHMWTKFHQDFSIYRIPITEVQVIREVDKGEATGGFEVRFVESDPVILQVERNFTSSFQSSRPTQFISRTPEGVNKLEIDKVLSAFPRNTLHQGNNAFQFLKAIGFYLTDNASVRAQILKSKVAVNYLYDRIERMGNENKIITNPLWALGQPYTYVYNGKTITSSGESGRVREIMKIEGKHSAKYSNNSITNVQGDQEYDLSLNNTITQLLKELNDLSKNYKDLVDQPHMAHLNIERNPFAKYSILLNSLFDLPVTYKEINNKNAGKRRNTSSKDETVQNATLDIVNLNGIKSMINDLQAAKEAEGGIKTTSLDINSKFLMDLHSMLEAGVMELTRRASKSSAFGVSVNKIFTKFNDNDPTSYISTGYFANETKANNAAVELIKDKIAAEMERIAIVKTGAFDNIPGFKETGKTFTMFDDILTSPGLKEDLIKAANADNSFNIVNSPEFSQRIYDDVVSYLDKLYTENKAIYDEMPFLSQQMFAKINKLTMADKTVANKNTLTIEKATEVALRSFTVNSLIHNMEIISIIDGDLAMYNHLKEEYHKRNAAVTSTGRIFSTDLSDYIIMSNLRKGNTYANKIGVTPEDFNGVLNSVVFGDNKVKSAYYDEYLEALTKKYGKEKANAILKPYTKMNEGDAQGWITFDAYRELSMLEGSWGPKQGELYEKIINGEKIDPEEITEFFPPRKYQYAGPLQTEKLHIQAFHKFSLAPLIPTVIKGTNMEIIHNNMVKQGVQYGVFESGSKMAILTKDGTPDKLYGGENRTAIPWDGTDETKYTKNPIFLQYLKNQVDISSKWKNKTIFSTQLRKLIINDLFKQGLGNSPELERIVTEFEGLLDTLQSYKKQELLKEIGWIEDENGNPTGKPESFIKFVRKELSRQDLADHDISFIDLNDAKTSIKYDLSYSLNAEKIEKLLNAIVVKRLVRQKMNGEQLVQLSGAGFETSNRTAFSKASEEDIKKYKGTNDLPTYRPGKTIDLENKYSGFTKEKLKAALKELENKIDTATYGSDSYRRSYRLEKQYLEDKIAGREPQTTIIQDATTAMKVKIAMKGDYYKLLELYHTDGKKIETLERLNTMLKSDKWLDKDDNRKLITMVGVRIPVQGLNSMEFMEVYEFLPEEAGNIIIPPAEIVAKSGADFDIDKLTVFQPNYSSSKKHAVYSKNDNAKGTENKIIESIRTILEHPDNFNALIRPNDTDIVKVVADDLAKENIHGYNPLQRKDGTIGETISPTRCLEPRYNLYKHEYNNAGKKTLSIGAVDNAYSSLFKRIGAYLNNNYTYRSWDKDNNKFKEHPREIKIRMDHNSIEINGEKHISLSDIETVTKDKISDLISQLMNGWVDVEKDAWIFNLNGDNVAGPVLLFMLEAGVDFRTAAYFVAQPLVIDYIKERTQADSPFYQSSGKGVNQGKGLNKFNIRKKMMGLTGNVSSKKMYAAIKAGVGNAQFTEESLFKTIQQKDKTSAQAKQALLHFFELEDVMRDLTNIKLTMNVDTKPTKSFFASQSKLVDIEGLDQTNVMDYAIVNRLKTKSPIRSFFTQMFQLKLFKPLMSVRADDTVNEYLKKFIKNGGNQNIFKDTEKFVSAYKNDIPLFILQNHLKRIDLNKITEYSTLKIGKGTPLEKAQIQIGAFVKDGVMYIDKQQLKKDFDNKSYTDKTETGYKQLGLHTLPLSTFGMSNNENTNFQEYVHYVLEREYLRSITPVAKDQTRAEYEKALAENALSRTFNFYTLLKGDNSIVTTFDRIKNAYPNLVNDYMIFDELVGSTLASDKGVKTLKLRSSRLDGEMANILHENLVRLSDPNTIKVENPAQNTAISKFFSRLIVGEYLRNGITKTSDSLAPILPTDMLSRLMEEPMKKLAASGITNNFLDIYTSLFEANWSSSKDSRNKFRNYLYEIKPPTLTDEEKTANKLKVQENEDGVKIYTNPYAKSEVSPLLTANPSIIFIGGVNQNNISEVLTDEFKNIGNFMGIPVKSKGGDIAWSDQNYDENIKAINSSLDAIQERIDNTGADIAFPADGLTTVKIGTVTKDVLMDKAPRTFEYLAKELYTRFKYVHPGSENFLGFRDVYQGDKGVSDKQVEDFMKQCFGE